MKEAIRNIYFIGKKMYKQWEKYYLALDNFSDEETQSFAAFLVTKYIISKHPLWPQENIKHCKFDMSIEGLVFTVLLDGTSPNNLDWVWYKIVITLEDINNWIKAPIK